MAIKIGKFYITRNNPRELLKEKALLQNIIDDLENWLLNNSQDYIGSKNTYDQGKKFAYYKAYERLQKLKKAWIKKSRSTMLTRKNSALLIRLGVLEKHRYINSLSKRA